jgi:hypothetical protein
MAFRSLRPRKGLWIYFGEGVPIDATNHRGGSASGVASLRAVQFNRNFQPRLDAIVFGETGGEFAVLK